MSIGLWSVVQGTTTTPAETHNANSNITNHITTMDCLQYCYCIKMPQELSGDNIMVTFHFFLVSYPLPKGSKLMYNIGSTPG